MSLYKRGNTWWAYVWIDGIRSPQVHRHIQPPQGRSYRTAVPR
jgi:hypothetical protein